jgi:hypothetical protein
MSQQRLTAFLQMVNVANPKFTETRSCLRQMLTLMRQQVASNNFNLGALGASIASARRDKRGAKYENALQYVERVWGHESLEYKGPNQAGYTGVAGRLNVLKNTVVTFREVDTGTTATHTFSVNSASHDVAGEITANIVFGANTYPVKAIVFELTPSVVFGNEFGSRSRTHVGVNEHMTLGFTVVPAGVTAVQAGNLLWTIYGAIPPNADTARQFFGKLQRANADTSAPTANGTACFIAPWATDAAHPQSPRPSQRTSTSTLRLVIQSGVSQGVYVELSLTVHTPVARMVAGPPYQHVHGTPSAGFQGDIYFDPKDVSFRYIEFKEGRGTMVAKQTGFRTPVDMSRQGPPRQLPASPSGYFGNWAGRVHQHTPIWVPIGPGDAVNGCKLTGSDSVYSGTNPRWPAPYDNTDGPLLAGKQTNEPSEVKWPIYWKYKAADLAVEVLSQQVDHKATMDASGAVTMSKAGASVTKNLNDATAP